MTLLLEGAGKSGTATGGGGGGGPPLDGLSGVTAAYSAARKMLTAYSANSGAFYRSATAPKIDIWYDQSGNAFNLTNPNAPNQPTIVSAGPNSRNMVDFDGTDDSIDSGVTFSSLITATTGYIIAAFHADDVSSSNESNIFDNDVVFNAPTADLGVCFKLGNLVAYNGVGPFTVDQTPTVAAISATTMYVVEWWHESGVLNCRLNKGTVQTVTSGNTGLGSGLRLGQARAAGGTGWYNGRIAELAIFNAVPSSGTRNTLATDLMTYYGAV